MQIPKVLSGLSDLTTLLGKRSGATEVAPANAATATTPDSAQSVSSTSALRDILSRYDMTDISPSDFSKLVQQLHDKGTISQKDMQELSSIRVDLENAGIDPDESTNLVDFYQQKIAKAQSDVADSRDPSAPQPNLDLLVGRLKWVAKFAAIHDQRGEGGMNAVA